MRAPLLLVVLCGCAGVPATPMGDEAPFDDVSATLASTLLTDDGGRVDWSHANGLVAFDRLGPDGFYDVWTMKPDGSEQVCFTCELDALPKKNVGQPAWHPSGAWLVVQVQKADSSAKAFGANPGRGTDNDLWAVSFPEGRAFLLHSAEQGTLHPHFSQDGARLSFTERLGGPDVSHVAGTWALVMADFMLTDGVPALSNVTQTLPGSAPAFYENHGLSPDGTRWIFSASLDPGKDVAEMNDIYWLDLAGDGALHRLTTAAYNEHATFLADGEHVLWMSSAGNPHRGTDYWLSKADGTELKRLTRLNGEQRGDRQVAADVSLGPDGRSFVAYVQQGLLDDRGHIVRFDGLP